MKISQLGGKKKPTGKIWVYILQARVFFSAIARFNPERDGIFTLLQIPQIECYLVSFPQSAGKGERL